MSQVAAAQVLVLSPVARVRQALADQVAAAGHAPWAGSGQADRQEVVEAVICHLPGTGLGALSMLEDLRNHHQDACLILVGRDHGAERTAALLRAGAFDYLTMPLSRERMEESLREGLEIRRSFLQVRELSDKLRAANQELGRERDSLREWNQNLVLLNDLSQSFAGTLDAEEIVRMVGERLVQILNVTLFGIGWLSPRRAWVHALTEVDEASIDRVRAGLLGGCEHQNGGERHGTGGTPEPDQPSAPAAPGDVLEVPMMIAKERVGLLRLQRRRGESFDPYQLELVKAMATPLALALRNAEAHLEVQSQAMTDGLTDLLNRRAFTNILAREFRETERYRTPLCLIMLDVDHFKSVNDRFGHLAGDRLLKEIAALIGQTIRTVDIATRYGGEEFAIILPRTEVAQAKVLANRIRELVEQQVFLANGLRIGLTVSLGIAQVPAQPIATVEEFVASADDALYQAKTRGRNRVEAHAEGNIPMADDALPQRERTGVGNAGLRC